MRWPLATSAALLVASASVAVWRMRRRRLLALAAEQRARLSQAVRNGDRSTLATLLRADPALANAKIGTDQAWTTPLHACTNVQLAQDLLAAGASVNATNHEGRKALHDCFEEGRDDIMECLLQRAELVLDVITLVCGTSKFYREAFARAGYNAEQRLADLLNAGADANDASTGLTPLGWASYGDSVVAAKLLCSAGAIVTDDCLHNAASCGHAAIIAFLVGECGAALNCRLADGSTPLHSAAKQRFTDDATSAAAALLQAGADPLAVDTHGRTPRAAAGAGQEVARLLALWEARAFLGAGDAPALAALLEAMPALVHERWQGSDPPYDGYFHGATLLHHVAGNPDDWLKGRPLPPTVCELVRVLLDAGAEVDAVTMQGPSQPSDIGWTALGLAATSSAARSAGVQLELLAALLARGADPGARNGGVLMGALYYGEEAAARWVAARLREASPPHGRLDLVAAAALGRVDLMATFVRRGGRLAPGAHSLVHYSQIAMPAEPSDADVVALALCYAAKMGQLAAMAWLRDELGADVSRRPFFDHRCTALHWAAHGGHDGCVQWLLDAGADPHAVDSSYSGSPADWAAHHGHSGTAELIRRHARRP